MMQVFMLTFIPHAVFRLVKKYAPNQYHQKQFSPSLTQLKWILDLVLGKIPIVQNVNFMLS